MNEIKLNPCPFCGKAPELCCDNTMVRCRACFNHLVFDIPFWNTRKGEPRKMCANCRHCSDYGVRSDITCLLHKNGQEYHHVCEDWEQIKAECPHKCSTCDQWVRISDYTGDKSDGFDRCHGHCGILETNDEDYYDYIQKFKVSRGIDPEDEDWREDFGLLDSPTHENDSCRYWKPKSDKI